MRIVVIGYGSIAKKHLDALDVLGIQKEIFLLRSQKPSEQIKGCINIYSINEIPEAFDFSIISNPTSKHKETLKDLIPLGKPIFLEKPILSSLERAHEINLLLEKYKTFVYPAFNLRFHPIIEWVKQNINPSEILEMQAYCGSYLPDWRKETDYRLNYSAKKELGGGVHLDLIHELDYITYILGFPEKISKFFSKKSKLEIDAIDCAHYWLEYKHCNVSILLNYYRRTPKRTLEIVMQNETYVLNLIEGNIYKGNGELVFQSEEIGIMQTYTKQMDHFLRCIEGQQSPINTFNAALKTLSLCL